PISVNLSTAAFASSRFPIITPSGYLPVCLGRPGPEPGPLRRVKYRVVDGGYFENSGITTMEDILTVLQASQPNSGRRPWYPVLIRIGFMGPPEEPVAPRPAGDPACPTRILRSDGLDEPLAPIRALFATRDGRGLSVY